MSKMNQSRAKNSKSTSKSFYSNKTAPSTVNERNIPEKVYVQSHNAQNALQSFIYRQRAFVQMLLDKNQKLAHQNSIQNVQLNNNEGTIMILNEKIAVGEKEVTKLKEEQERLLENKNALRLELMAYKKRCSDLLIYGEKEKMEIQQMIEKQQNELKEHESKETEFENKLDVIRQELQNKIDECGKSNETMSLLESEVNASKQHITDLEQSLINFKEDLKEKDETINKLRKEHADYKAETEQTIKKMKDVNKILYPNATNPLPKTTQNNEIRSSLPTSIVVQPRSQSRSAFKRCISTSSLESVSDNETGAILEGWAPPRNINNIFSNTGHQTGFDSRTTDVPGTPESIVQPRKKRFRH